jgi:hypothetical protein
MPRNSVPSFNVTVNLPRPGWRASLLLALRTALRQAIRSALIAVLRSTPRSDRSRILERRSVRRSIVLSALSSDRYRSAILSLLVHVPTTDVVPSNVPTTDVVPCTTVPFYQVLDILQRALQSSIYSELHAVRSNYTVRCLLSEADVP